MFLNYKMAELSAEIFVGSSVQNKASPSDNEYLKLLWSNWFENLSDNFSDNFMKNFFLTDKISQTADM